MLALHPLPAHQLTEADARWLVKIAERGYGSSTAKRMVERGLRGELQFWRIEGTDAEGLLVTKLTLNATGRTLWIEGLAGRGLLRQHDALTSALDELARRANANSIRALVFREGMKWASLLSGFSHPGVVLFREVS